MRVINAREVQLTLCGLAVHVFKLAFKHCDTND